MEDNEPSKKMLEYNPETGQWKELAPMPTPRGALTVSMASSTQLVG
ncbi:MAG TPA: kelch repeat-containing protein [Nitrososphaera sp.]|nr:kelch repeat-containing protein [Nitrososphaera sp.]